MDVILTFCVVVLSASCMVKAVPTLTLSDIFDTIYKGFNQILMRGFMSEMTMYFQSLERAADLAIQVNEVLQSHPGAVAKYKDEEYNEQIINALSELESAIEDPKSSGYLREQPSSFNVDDFFGAPI